MLPSDPYEVEGTPSNTAIDKSEASFHPNGIIIFLI
jgi:hypothetical protein